MAMESQPNLDPKLPPSGLCNAIMLSKPHSSFVGESEHSLPQFDPKKKLTADSLPPLRPVDRHLPHLQQGRVGSTQRHHSLGELYELSPLYLPLTCLYLSQALAQEHPTEITVLNKFAFFWPLWCVALSTSLTYHSLILCSHRHDDHLRLVHRTTSFSFHSPSPLAPTRDTQFAYHLWESADEAERYLGPYDPDRIHNRGAKKGEEREEDGASDENAFSREGRRWISEEFRREWREARKRGEV